MKIEMKMKVCGFFEGWRIVGSQHAKLTKTESEGGRGVFFSKVFLFQFSRFSIYRFPALKLKELCKLIF